jgi:hypothetical protein
MFSKGKLSDNKINMLNAIEFEWEVSTEKLKLPRRSTGQLRGDARWKKMYKELKKFHTRNGTFNVPSDSPLYLCY